MTDYKTTLLGSPQTMIGYAVVIRILPVALVIASMAAATAIGVRALRACASGSRSATGGGKGYIKFSNEEEDGGGEAGGGDCDGGGDDGGGGTHDEGQGGIAGYDIGSSEADAGLHQEGCHSFLEGHSLLRTVEIEDVLSDNPEIGGPRGYEHDVRVGRPNIEALVRAAHAGIQQQELPTIGQRRLVVVACGPSEMVKTARKAVVEVRAACHCKRVRVEFSGADWRW